ncbi:unnamed protein product [Phytomonas sp. Hart1]|nr:unnamed protein product [Phytomonas sp. Hart1]|eukprot:CCW71971.1 unnamed protein product [Phytomonas sp. isolate Hart1]
MNIKVFANAGVSDSLDKPPRASVGVSLVSLRPRLTVDRFNKILPRTFECSFNWMADFNARRLRSGLEESETGNFLRISPVERFQHMRCGLTWQF